MKAVHLPWQEKQSNTHLARCYSNNDTAWHMRTLKANASCKHSFISDHFYNECQNISVYCVWMPKCQSGLFSDGLEKHGLLDVVQYYKLFFNSGWVRAESMQFFCRVVFMVISKEREDGLQEKVIGRWNKEYLNIKRSQIIGRILWFHLSFLFLSSPPLLMFSINFLIILR